MEGTQLFKLNLGIENDKDLDLQVWKSKTLSEYSLHDILLLKHNITVYFYKKSTINSLSST